LSMKWYLRGTGRKWERTVRVGPCTVLIQPATCEGGREGRREGGREGRHWPDEYIETYYLLCSLRYPLPSSLPPSLPPNLPHIGHGRREGHKQNVGRREDDTLLPHCASLRIVHIVELVEDNSKHLRRKEGGRERGRKQRLNHGKRKQNHQIPPFLPPSLPPSLPSYLVELAGIARVEHVPIHLSRHDGHLGREGGREGGR